MNTALNASTQNPTAGEGLILVLLLLVAPTSLLYVVFYLYRPWRSTPQGRALMIKGVSNAILLNMGLAYALFGEYPGRPIIRILGFSLLVFGINYLLITLLTAPGAEEYPPRSWLRRFRRR